MAKMTLTEKEATDLLVAVGLVIAPKWDATKKQEKLAVFDKMAGIEEKVAKISDESVRKTGERTLKACAAKVNIKVAEDSPAEKPDAEAGGEDQVDTNKKLKTPLMKMEKSKPVKPDAAKPKKPDAPAKEKKEKKSAVEKDQWGTREGTRTARINAVLLTGKAYSTKEIEEKADARQIGSHLSKLMQCKRIERTPDGKYQLVGPKPEKVKKVKK